MAYIAGVDRSQQVMFPEALDDYVGPENPVRFIDAFVASLDLADLGVARAVPNEMGRPAYDPGDLLRLYVYGYLNRIRTSRRLEREAQRNVELMWLLRRLAPDFKTIADFRRENAAALKRVCREFTLLCKRLDLFGGEIVAIDGSKFRAVNGRQQNVTAKELEKQLHRLDGRIAEYLAALEAGDRADAEATPPGAGGDGPGDTSSGGGSGGSGGGSLAEKIALLRRRKEAYTALKADMDAKGDTQRSLTDPESRLMKVGTGVQVCYNVQTAVDAKHKLIVAHEVTNDVTDHAWLSPMARAANEVLESQSLHAIADRGYYKAPEITACLESGITPTVPRPETSSSASQGLFTKADFTYDAARDEYECPAGNRLTYRASTVDRTGIMQRRYATAACGMCGFRAQCTRAKRGGRYILRWEGEELLEAMAKRLAERPELRTRRQELAEHPYGTMKRGMDQGYFLTRGLENVRGEMSLTVLVYNLRRAINILGVRKLLDAMSGRLLSPQFVAAAA
jgi:transposase